MHIITRYAITFILLTQILATTLPLTLRTMALTKVVEPGNTFKYGRSDNKPWVWSDPSDAPVRDEWAKYVNLTTIDFKITQSQLSTPNSIRFNMTINFENQTALNFQDGIDLQTGAGQGLIFFASAELNRGDRIYPGYENFTWTINDTRSDPDWGNRRISVLNHTVLQVGAKSNYTTSVIYWDWQTGVLLSVYESKASALQISGVTYTVEGGVFYELIDNNIGIPKPQHSGSVDTTLLVLIIVAILIAAFVVIIVRMSTTAPKKKWKRIEE